MITNGFTGMTDKEKRWVADYIAQAFVFADYFDVRDYEFELANDEFADIVVEKLTEWEKSEEWKMDMHRCESIELFCENHSDEWKDDLRKNGFKYPQFERSDM